MKNIKAIAFDLDGTLIHSLPDLVASANHVREYFGMMPLDEKIIESYIGDGVEKLLHRTLTGDRNGSDLEKIDKAKSLFEAYYSANLTVNTILYPEIVETLDQLSHEYSLALITNKPEVFAKEILDYFDISKYFDVIYGGDSLKTRKPSPEPLFAAAKAMNTSAENMLMVGDSINDILAGKAAGSPTVFVTYGYGNNDIFKKAMMNPDYQIDKISGIIGSF